MEKILTGFADFVSFVVGTLGISGTLFAILGLLLLWLVLICGRALLRFLFACLKVWRKLPTMGKQIVGLVGLASIYILIWPYIPKTESVLAVGGGFVMFWWMGGNHLAKQYGIDGGYRMWKPWVHHWETISIQRGFTQAVEDATGKKHGKARAPRATDTGWEVPIEPPDGMSASEVAEDANEGRWTSAIARMVGWDKVRVVKATVQRDGTVLAIVERVREEAADPLAEDEWVEL